MAYDKRNVDDFGNPFTVVGCKENKRGFAVGYTTLKGSRYKIEPTDHVKKDGVMMWVRITKVPNRGSGEWEGGNNSGASRQRRFQRGL